MSGFRSGQYDAIYLKISLSSFFLRLLNVSAAIAIRCRFLVLTLFASNQDGSITDEERNYLKVRGKDIGLYILGATMISKEGMSTHNILLLWLKKIFHHLKKEQKL